MAGGTDMEISTGKQLTQLLLTVCSTLYTELDFSSPESIEEQMRDIITELEMELV